MRLLKLVAWVMVLVGGSAAAATLILAILPFHPRAGSATTAAGFRYPFLAVAYLSSATSVTGFALIKRGFWAWDVTVNLSFTFAFVGFILPISAAHVKNSTLTGIGTTAFIGLTLLSFPNIVVIWHLFTASVRQNFETKGLVVPTMWVRLIASSFLLGSGLEIISALNPDPKPLFGLLKNGTALGLYAISNGALMIVIGRGLYRLRETARLLAVGSIIWSVIERGITLLGSQKAVTPATTITFAGTTAIYIGMVWYLHTRRQLFIFGRTNRSVVLSEDSMPED